MLKIYSVALALIGILPICAPAQPPSQPTEATRQAMAKLNFLDGRWEGTGTLTMGPGRKENCRVIESCQFKLQRSVLVLEGQGTIASTDGSSQIVHDAMAILSWDAQQNRYRMRSYRAGSELLDPEIEVQENRIVWSFKDARAGQIRFTLTVEGDRWKEIGEVSPPGVNRWFPFFEMQLRRQATATTTP
ncbi:MAG: hypothetical protein MI861_13590 [Pirellulales bacterium]|nr:hypothetical protein [Pirellulales bacterium]